LRDLAEQGVTGVLIPDAVIDAIWAYVRARRDGREQGGLLLGYRKSDAIQIESATFPGRWDRSSAALFQRSERGHRLRALREWVRSARTIDWVGEWHTHPGGVVRPSFIDRRSWIRLARHTSAPMTFLIFNDSQIYVGLQCPLANRVAQLAVAEQGTSAILYE
jgi:integrative and conjugative element protein (TIGR02256 family)